VGVLWGYGVWDSREWFSLYYLNSKGRMMSVIVGWVQSAGCRRTKSRYKYYMNIIYNELGKNQRNI